ncbi:hypothetical protein [Aquimarina sediminis]|uniref:hypothetical protein n=1 Tax=Aquimarina sediminis TaxID=2070536 RepID=UPI000FFEADAE|nr:hypothetical protein [Aquimarina sediminis]
MRLMFTLLLLIFSLLTLGQEKTTFKFEDEKKLNIELKGKVKKVVIKKENLKNDNSESIVYEFDENGIPLKIRKNGLGVDVINRMLRDEGIHYKFKKGKLLSKLNKMTSGLDGEIYQYDDNWNLVLEKHFINNILVKEISQNFDDENRLSLKTEYLYGGFSDYNVETEKEKEAYLYKKEEYKYDICNNLISKTEQNFRKDFIEETSYKYDPQNNLIEEGHCFVGKGERDCKYKPLYGFDYDKKNRLIKKYQLAQFSPHNTDTYYKYDSNGNEIEAIGYYIYPNKESVIGYKFRYEYNQSGNKTKDIEVIGKYRRLRFDKYKTEITKYDDFQNIILEEYVTESGQPIKVVVNTYQYDDNGNWIKKEMKEGTNHNDLELIDITTRKIEYY